MDRLVFGILFMGLFVPPALGTNIFGGLAELAAYESEIPCDSSSKKKCFATNGVMGMALDKASEAGLQISKIQIKDKEKVYVQTKKYGVCLVETKNLEQLGEMGFLCSSSGLKKAKLKKVDRVFSLTKKGNEQFALVDITESRKLKGSL